MTDIVEGSLTFQFDDGVASSKYDDWAFYRCQFADRCSVDNKAVDLLCIQGRKAWMIEVKDYRLQKRTKPIDLADEVATKVRDTLAGLLAAKIRANDLEEKQFARELLKAIDIRVVCHLEQPKKASRLRPRAIEPDKLKDKLRRLVKAIDPHPYVIDSATIPASAPWQVH